MPAELTIVDAFTDRPFAGNPAAICVLDAPAPEAWLRDVAREMNLSETAFLLRLDRSAQGAAPLSGIDESAWPGLMGRRDAPWSLRWLTPTTEVDLCGHATLAAAHVLAGSSRVEPGAPILFQTRSGVLGAQVGATGLIVLDFPATPVTASALPPMLIETLGLRPEQVTGGGRARFDYLVEVATEGMVAGCAPDHKRLAKLDVRGVMVTAPANPDGLTSAHAASREDRRGYDFVSRFFAPGSGIDEDPVTGSAHCALGPWWAAKLGRADLLAFQASPRGGTVRVHAEPNTERVKLGGHAVTVSHLTLLH